MLGPGFGEIGLAEWWVVARLLEGPDPEVRAGCCSVAGGGAAVDSVRDLRRRQVRIHVTSLRVNLHSISRQRCGGIALTSCSMLEPLLNSLQMVVGVNAEPFVTYTTKNTFGVKFANVWIFRE